MWWAFSPHSASGVQARVRCPSLGAEEASRHPGSAEPMIPSRSRPRPKELDAEAWLTIAWCEATNTELNSRFAAVRLRPASRDYNRREAHAQEWLLIEWPEGEVEPSKYGSPPGRPTLRSPSWSMTPSCVGGSSETIRSSSKSWHWATTKAEVGGASIHHANLCIAAMAS